MNYFDDENRWPYEPKLNKAGISTRVDFAKFAVHNSIISSSSPDHIFIEDILNIFIALVQHPLNFIFFNEEKKCIFHFCKDPFHKKKFDVYANNLSETKKDIFFDFFNYDSCESLRYISIIYMDTKNNNDFIAIEKNSIDLNINKTLLEREHIGICAKLFFSQKWSTLDSCASSLFLSGINSSINELSEQNLENQQEAQSKSSKRNSQDTRGSLNIEKLLDRMSSTLFGIQKSASYVSQLSQNTSDISKPFAAPNTLLAFRDYGVKKDYSRFFQAYDYKTRFIVSEGESLNFQYRSILNDLRKGHPMTKNLGPISCIESYKDELKGRLPYSEIIVNEEKRGYLTKALDFKFWELLHAEDNSSKKMLSDILAVPVGDKARSLVDPVYQTGLIHFNRIFEQAGLDRINDDSISEILSQDGLTLLSDDSGLIIDLLRIVLLYYLISTILGRTKDGYKHPEDILCVLFPVKIKGVCWAVAIQAFYVPRTQLDHITDEYDKTAHRHGEQHLWTSNFLLTTTFRRRIFSSIDSTCWEFAQQHVIKSVAECSLDLFERKLKSLDVENKLNIYMLRISAYLPYSFPEFRFSTTNEAQSKNYKGWIPLNPHGGSLCLAWNIVDNIYYSPTQKWNKISTRSFKSSIELGMSLSRDRYFESNKVDS